MKNVIYPPKRLRLLESEENNRAKELLVSVVGVTEILFSNIFNNSFEL